MASLVSQALSRIYAQRYGIGVPEWRVLVTLGQFGVMTGKAIGTHSHMHKTKVSRAVAMLEKRKLLVRRANRADLREVVPGADRRRAGRCTRSSRRSRSTSRSGWPTPSIPRTDPRFDRALQRLTERSEQTRRRVRPQQAQDGLIAPVA